MYKFTIESVRPHVGSTNLIVDFFKKKLIFFFKRITLNTSRIK